MNKVNLKQKLGSFTDTWAPKVVGRLNGQSVKVVKVQGEYVWHHHADEDEMFLVLRGHLAIHLRDGVVELDEGEFFIVPRGVEHKPVAAELAELLLFEPDTTRNTGNVDHAYSIEPGDLETI